MARIARKNYDSSYFHVIVQGYEKQSIFGKDYFKGKFLRFLINEMNKFDVEIMEYCIMYNHAHLLLYCDKIEQMSLYMQSVNSQYALFYNKKNGRVGYVFRDRFLSEPIKNQNYLYSCMAYIHLNPVVARIVSYPEQYKYSSYQDFLYKKGIVTDSVLIKLFNTNCNYIELFKFIHFEKGIGIEYKKDLPKLDFFEADKFIDNILKECCINDLKQESVDIQKYFFKLFIRNGVGIYQIEKILKIDHRKVKKIILC